jgi:hypothetical protein
MSDSHEKIESVMKKTSSGVFMKSNNNHSTSSCYSWLIRYLPSYKVLAILGWTLLLTDLYLNHRRPLNEGISTMHGIVIPKDRSSTYHVKILPTMDDDALEKLPEDSFSYIAMIDAGSSGCRVHVYRYGKVGSMEGPLYILPKHVSLKVKPGLSSFKNDPSAAGASLKGLVDFVKTKVPASDWGDTPIWLKATAGLRMLEPKTSDAILDSVRSFLGNSANSPLLFRPMWAKIIPGQEEGAFGWIAYNYLKRIIGPKKNTADIVPFAVIEMGGASAQVTQLAPSEKDISEIPEDYRYAFTIEGQTYTLYTHSYLGYGSEQARESYNHLLLSQKAGTPAATDITDPCLYEGYVRADKKSASVYEGPDGESVQGGAQQTGKCLSLVKQLFQAPIDTTCDAAIIKSRSFGCVYQPKFLIDSLNFLVFENYYYVASGIGIMPSGHAPEATSTNAFPLITSVKEMEDSSQDVCGQSWTNLNANYPKDNSGKDSNIKFCFTASLMASFLTDGLGLDRNKQLTIQQSVGNSDIEWALGAAYKEAADFLKKDYLRGSSGNS